MKDFEGFIKNYATRDFIYFFAEKSIEIYKNQVEKLDEHLVCNITFPLNIIQHGFIHKQAKVMLSAWDIPNMAYLSITNANDYRNDIMTEQLAGRVVNLYRGYENKHSGSEYIKNNDAGLILVTHEYELAMRCDKVYKLEELKLQEIK